MGPQPYPNLLLTMASDRLSSFSQLLQRGLTVKTSAGSSIRDFLYRQLRLTPEYVEESIKTIFLDGKPVDDIDAAAVHDGATLALSGAMPGLVGATMRKGGFFASLRSSISYKETDTAVPHQGGSLLLKLFNVVAHELGPVLLQEGVWLKREYLEDFLKAQGDAFWAACTSITLDGIRRDARELQAPPWPNDVELVRFAVSRSDG